MLPIQVVNKITEYVSEINDDDFVIKFCEIGKINKITKRLCVCLTCKQKIRTVMRVVVNRNKFALKIVNHLDIQSTYQMIIATVDNNRNDGHMICITNKSIMNEFRVLYIYKTYIITYESQHFGNQYIILKDVVVNARRKFISHGTGIIINQELPNKITEVESIACIRKGYYLNEQHIVFDEINIKTRD